MGVVVARDNGKFEIIFGDLPKDPQEETVQPSEPLPPAPSSIAVPESQTPQPRVAPIVVAPIPQQTARTDTSRSSVPVDNRIGSAVTFNKPKNAGNACQLSWELGINAAFHTLSSTPGVTVRRVIEEKDFKEQVSYFVFNDNQNSEKIYGYTIDSDGIAITSTGLTNTGKSPSQRWRQAIDILCTSIQQLTAEEKISGSLYARELADLWETHKTIQLVHAAAIRGKKDRQKVNNNNDAAVEWSRRFNLPVIAVHLADYENIVVTETKNHLVDRHNEGRTEFDLKYDFRNAATGVTADLCIRHDGWTWSNPVSDSSGGFVPICLWRESSKIERAQTIIAKIVNRVAPNAQF